MASLNHLVLHVILNNGSVSGRRTPIELDHHRAVHVELVPTTDKVSNFPTDPPLNFDKQRQRSDVTILIQRRADEGRNRDGGAGDERGPYANFLMALVKPRDESVESDLLVPVNGGDVEVFVVDSDAAVGVAGRDSEEEIGGEETGDGGVEGVDGDVLEEESGLGGAEDGPDYKDAEEEEED